MMVTSTYRSLSCLVLLLSVSACSPPESAFEARFSSSPDRTWIGPHYWANSLADWRFKDGRLVSQAQDSARKMNALFLLTHTLNGLEGSLRMSVETGFLDAARVDSAGVDSVRGLTGFGIGLAEVVVGSGKELNELNEEDGQAPIGGFFVGVDGSGRIVARGNSAPLDALGSPSGGDARDFEHMAARGILTDLSHFGVRVMAASGSSGYSMVVETFDPGSDEILSHAVYTGLAPELFEGGVALIAQSNASTPGSAFWFEDWKLEGSKVEMDLSKLVGPVMAVEYNILANRLELRARMARLGKDDSKVADLQIMQNGEWVTRATGELDFGSYTIDFEIKNWLPGADTIYRVKYSLWEGAHPVTYYFEGVIRS